MARVNLLLNPSWEYGLGRWTAAVPGGAPADTYSREINATYGARSGSYYAFTRRTTAGRLNIYPTDFAPVTAGASYAASIWINRDGTGAATLDIDWYSGNGTGYLSSSTGTLNPGSGVTDWGRISVVGTAPTGATYARMFLHFDNMQANFFVRVDAALFERSATVGTYFDGDTTPYANWNGTEGDSTSTLSTDNRSGQGRALVGVGAREDGAKQAKTSVRAALGHSGRAAGAKAVAGNSRAAVGHAGRGSGAKRGTGTGLAPSLGITTRAAGAKRGVGIGWFTPLGLSAYGSAPPPVPIFNGRPLAEDPLPLADSRYLVQNILTGEWLHTDLPLSGDQVTLTLSGPCEISGKITPEQVDLKAPDGQPLLRSWGHVVYLEMDGEIRAAGLITEDSYDDQTQTLVCRGVSSYPGMIPYQGNYRRYFADPLTVAQDMWAYVQSFANGNLGVAFTRTGSIPAVLYGGKVNPVPGDKLAGVTYAPRPTTGTDDDPPINPVRLANTLPAVFQALIGKGYKTRGVVDPTKPGSAENSIPADTIFVRKADLEQAYADYLLTVGQPYGLTFQNPPDTTSSVAIEPYKVDWWDVRMCGSVIDEAMKALPGDYVEQYAWNYPRTFVDQTVAFSYPRVGRRREDLRFVQGENIVSAPGLEADPDGFATAVVGIGAGEGSDSLRETAEMILPGRIRKVYVYRNSRITDRATLKRLVAGQLIQRANGGYEVTSIVVQASHVNAVFGTYNQGDDIPVQVEVPHFGWITQWGRIVSMTLAREDDLVEISLRRSDSFYYGREVTD